MLKADYIVCKIILQTCLCITLLYAIECARKNFIAGHGSRGHRLPGPVCLLQKSGNGGWMATPGRITQNELFLSQFPNKSYVSFLFKGLF